MGQSPKVINEEARLKADRTKLSIAGMDAAGDGGAFAVGGFLREHSGLGLVSEAQKSFRSHCIHP